MKLVDFLIQLLEAHAQTLQRLAALFGEPGLLQLLEEAGELPDLPPIETLKPEYFQPPHPGEYPAYAQLEGAVREVKLPAVLEFHLWAYPHYRAFIESSIDLNSRIQGAGGDAGQALVDEAVARAQNWVQRLPMPPGLGLQAERAAHIPWLKFRSNVLKRIGRRPMGPVY